MMQRPPQDYTITFLTFEALDEIGMTDKFAETVGLQLLNIIDGSRSSREYQKVREDVDALLGEMNAETVVAIDDLGFDYIVLDEAHNMKKLFTNVRAADDKEAEDDKGRYQMNSGTPSKQAVKTFMITQYINSITRGRNVVLLTATPFTNNPLEIFSMLVLVAYEKLKQNGIVNIRAFFDLFVNETTEYVVTASNRIELKSVVKGFDNRTTLQALVFGSMIHKTGEEAKVVRPIKVEYPRLKGKDGVPLPEDMQVDTALVPTPVQREWMREIAKLALGENNKIASLLPAHYFDPKNNKVYAAALLAVSLGRQCILSPYLMRAKRSKDTPGQSRIVEDDEIDTEDESGKYIYFLGKPNPTAAELFESSPKLQYTLGCIKTIKAHHESRNEEMSGVVIYLDGATEYHRPIMDYMADELGLSKQQVAVINGKTAKKTKENIKERFLAGKVKVLMGSSTIQEGIDLQIKSTTLFNLTLPWNPTQLQQLHGRIWRQKNQHSYVRIATPLMEDSVDIFLFQKLDEKTARINTIWYRAGRVNVLNVDDFNPEELKFALMTDPEQRAKIEIENATAELKHKHVVLTENARNLAEAAETIRLFNEVQVQVDQWHREAREWMERDVMQVRARLKANDYTRKDVLERDENRERRIDSILEADNDPENQPKASYAVIKFHANNDLGEYGEAKGRLIERKEEVDRQLKRTEQLTRLQKNVLNQYGVTVVDDLQPVMDDMAKELEVVNERLKELQSEEYKKEVVERLKREREESANRSRPVEYRVQQFTTHNHLLSCLKDVHDCSIDEQVVRIKKGAVVQLPTMTEAKAKDADKEMKRKRMVMMARAAEARARALDIDITSSIAA
jgi:superfamily II DNA/RNA helicase